MGLKIYFQKPIFPKSIVECEAPLTSAAKKRTSGGAIPARRRQTPTVTQSSHTRHPKREASSEVSMLG